MFIFLQANHTKGKRTRVWFKQTKHHTLVCLNVTSVQIVILASPKNDPMTSLMLSSFPNALHYMYDFSLCTQIYVCVHLRVFGCMFEVNFACCRGCVSDNPAMQSQSVSVWTCQQGDDEQWLLSWHPSVVVPRDGCFIKPEVTLHECSQIPTQEQWRHK